jgi:hypothetical protein
MEVAISINVREVSHHGAKVAATGIQHLDHDLRATSHRAGDERDMRG